MKPYRIVEKLIKGILNGDDAAVSKYINEQHEDLLLNEIISILKNNRLEPFLFSSKVQLESDDFRQWVEDRKSNSVFSVAASYRIFNKGMELITALTEAKIDHFALRGPFDAAQLYGDISFREYGDVDIFVRPEDTAKAWDVAVKKGFSLYHDEMPKGFFRRHHLNWALIHPESKVMCDLHWAVDHPYRSLTIDYAAIFDASKPCYYDNSCWKGPSPEHWLILSALHLRKHHASILTHCLTEDALQNMLALGDARYLVDAATFINANQAELDWAQLAVTAEKWNAVQPLAALLFTAKNLLDLSPEHEISRLLQSWDVQGYLKIQELPSRMPSLKVVEKLARVSGFNGERLLELGDYILPATYQTEKRGLNVVFKKMLHGFLNSLKLSFAVMDCFISCLGKKLLLRFSSKKRTNKDVRGNAVYV